MNESQYLQQVRSLVKQFKEADLFRQNAEQNTTQTYKSECERAELELQKQQKKRDHAKAEAKSRYDLACQASAKTLEDTHETATINLTRTKDAENQVHKALTRVNLSREKRLVAFQPPAIAGVDFDKEFIHAVDLATKTAQTIQDETVQLQRLREKLRQRREFRKKLLLAASIASVIIIVIIGFWINRAIKAQVHYKAAFNALEAKNWETARQELEQVSGIYPNYKDTQTLVKESYYRPVALALEENQWEEARRKIEELRTIDPNYKEPQTLLKESYYRPVVIALEKKQLEEAQHRIEELLAIDQNYKDTQTLFKEIYYQLASVAIKAKRWNEAQSLLEKISSIDKGYKDVVTLQKDIAQLSWNEKTSDMTGRFNEIVGYQEKANKPEEMIAKWQQFLTSFAENDPSSKEDDSMRQKAKTWVDYWQQKKTDEEEKQRKLVWSQKIKNMTEKFNEITEYQQKNSKPEEMIAKWQQFLTSFAEDNPYSQQDDSMRQQAKESIKINKEMSYSEGVYRGTVQRRYIGGSKTGSRIYEVKLNKDYKTGEVKIYELDGDFKYHLKLTGSFEGNVFKGETGVIEASGGYTPDKVTLIFSEDGKSLDWKHNDGSLQGDGHLLKQ